MFHQKDKKPKLFGLLIKIGTIDQIICDQLKPDKNPEQKSVTLKNL